MLLYMTIIAFMMSMFRFLNLQDQIEEWFDLDNDRCVEDVRQINKFISEKKYGEAIEFFNESHECYEFEFKVRVYVRIPEKCGASPKIFKEDYFGSSLADKEKEWKNEIANGKTKLGFEEWQKKQKRLREIS